MLNTGHEILNSELMVFVIHIQQMHIYKHVQLHIIIFHQHVLVTPVMTISVHKVVLSYTFVQLIVY
jgi:hypothetical protein